VSDASGPFAVPNFSQADPSDDEEFDDEELEASGSSSAAGPDETSDDHGDEANDRDDEATDGVVDGVVDGGAAQAVLEHIARSIVDEPDAVQVDVSSQRGGVRLDLHVASTDMGRIIGRRGRVAQALRAVVRAAAAKDGADATVDIVD
jgi:hypothetical protein